MEAITKIAVIQERPRLTGSPQATQYFHWVNHRKRGLNGTPIQKFIAISGTSYDQTNFQPPPKVAPYAETTLPKRNYDDHVPDAILKRVNEAPGNITQLRCLIDNMECRHVVDYAHVLSRADGRKDKLVSDKGPFTLKTSDNIIDIQPRAFLGHRTGDAKF